MPLRYWRTKTWNWAGKGRCRKSLKRKSGFKVMQSCLPLSLTSSIEIWGYWWWLKTDSLKRLTMSNKEATGDDKNHGRLFHLTTIYFFMLTNISTTTIQTLLTDRKFSHLWIELIDYFTLFKIKKCTLVIKNKYTKGNSIEYFRAFFWNVEKP